MANLRVLICGGRDFDDYDWLEATLEAATLYGNIQFTQIIHGGARGADRLADRWAKAWGIPVREFAADWVKHGRSAGPIRNQQMIDDGHPDLVIAFPGGRGTEDMIRRAEGRGIKIERVTK